jgi:hypothetical protein
VGLSLAEKILETLAFSLLETSDLELLLLVVLAPIIDE